MYIVTYIDIFFGTRIMLIVRTEDKRRHTQRHGVDDSFPTPLFVSLSLSRTLTAGWKQYM